jgi:hypothetical protein
MQGFGELNVTGTQRRSRHRVAGRDVIQNENVVVNVRIAARPFAGVCAFKQLDAGLDTLSQGYQVQNDHAINAILDVRRGAACGGLHDVSPSPSFFSSMIWKVDAGFPKRSCLIHKIERMAIRRKAILALALSALLVR